MWGYESGRVHLSDVMSQMMCQTLQVWFWMVAGMMHLGIDLQSMKNGGDFPVGGAVINEQLSNFEIATVPLAIVTFRRNFRKLLVKVPVINLAESVNQCWGRDFKPNNASSHLAWLSKLTFEDLTFVERYFGISAKLGLLESLNTTWTKNRETQKREKNRFFFPSYESIHHNGTFWWPHIYTQGWETNWDTHTNSNSAVYLITCLPLCLSVYLETDTLRAWFFFFYLY